MKFRPRAELLDWEELDRVAGAFVALGVKNLRLTGGEPLLRRGFVDFVGKLSRHLHSAALDELTITTNGTNVFLLINSAETAIITIDTAALTNCYFTVWLLMMQVGQYTELT